MRKLSVVCAAYLVAACAVHAAPQYVTLSIASGTNIAGTATSSAIAGWIDEVILELPSGATTGTVSVTATPPVIGSAVTIASKAISATTTIRPRFDGTTSAGVANTSDPPERYMAFGDLITATLSVASHTGKTWRVTIKYDDMRR